MANIITVEDYNSVLMNYKDSFYYVIDTTMANNQSNINFDFVNINRRLIGGSPPAYQYVISFQNKLWTGEYIVLDKNNEVVNVNLNWGASLYEDTFACTFVRSKPEGDNNPYKIVLYMTPLLDKEWGEIEYIKMNYQAGLLNNVFLTNDNDREYLFDINYFGTQTITDDFVLILETIDGEEIEIDDYEIIPERESDVSIKFIYSPITRLKETLKLKIGATNLFYFYQKEFKKKNLVNWEFDLACGSNLNYSNLEVYYFENIKATISYNDIEETYEFTQKNIEIPIKLGNVLKEEPIDITLKLTEGEYTPPENYVFKVTPIITSYGNFQSLKTALTNTDGVKILKLKNNITFTENININHDVIIQGNDFNLDLNGFSIINNGYTIKLYDTNFINGNPAIKQKANSNVEISNCHFENCTNENTDNLGTCIQCDTTIDSLNLNTDFITNIQNTDFINSSGAILHGGELIVNNCKFLINNHEVINNVPAFLYQTDGECSIRNSIFDINIDTNYFCENQIDVKLGQALLVCGKTAIINGKTYEDLKRDNNIGFFGNPYNNISHIFLKYYYPNIEDCVFISPIPNREDRNICYAVSGIDWIYKENVQITRASWQTENRINKIEW